MRREKRATRTRTESHGGNGWKMEGKVGGRMHEDEEEKEGRSREERRRK